MTGVEPFWLGDKESKQHKDWDMAEVTKFEDKVKEALSAVMKHAVTGHFNGGYNTFCNEAQHAMHILAEHGVKPANAAVLDRMLDLDRGA